MTVIEELKKIVADIPSVINEKDEKYSFEILIAERKAFLSKKKLIYCAQFHVHEQEKEVKFTEMLKESGVGMNSGIGDDGIGTGFGFKTESYNTLSGAREGNIEEQSDLFGKKYNYNFDFGKIRKSFEKKTEELGYKFSYQITSMGL